MKTKGLKVQKALIVMCNERGLIVMCNVRALSSFFLGPPLQPQGFNTDENGKTIYQVLSEGKALLELVAECKYSENKMINQNEN